MVSTGVVIHVLPGWAVICAPSTLLLLLKVVPLLLGVGEGEIIRTDVHLGCVLARVLEVRDVGLLVVVNVGICTR